MNLIKQGIVLALAGLFVSSMALAQDKSNRPSPPATATGTVAGSVITITYSSPAVNGRQIWGGLVPYGKVWRAGANEATIFEASKEIQVEGKTLPAGKYSLYALPGEKEWTIILNSETGQWGIKRGGETTEDPAKDILRVTVKPQKASDFHERMIYTVGSKGFSLVWENLEVPVAIN